MKGDSHASHVEFIARVAFDLRRQEQGGFHSFLSHQCPTDTSHLATVTDPGHGVPHTVLIHDG